MPRRDGSTVAGYHMAAGIALRSALEAAQVTTLEPLMFVEISAPEANLGPAISLFGTRGGKLKTSSTTRGSSLCRALPPPQQALRLLHRPPVGNTRPGRTDDEV